MSLANSHAPNLMRFAVLATASAFAAGGVASAGKGDPAPIVFAGDQPGESSGMTGREARVQTKRAVQFRYPDQPNVSYGPQGPVSLGDDAPPFAFSSSQAAITPEEARRYAAPADPALTPGAFDARAAAASSAAAPRVDRPIEVAALSPTPAAQPVVRPAIDYSTPVRPAAGFQPAAAPNFAQEGMASWYGPNYDGKPTASGEIFDQTELTGAHPTLPLPSLVEVTNVENGRKVVVRINDRGPFVDDRIIDVSRRAAELLGFEQTGLARVAVRYIGPAGPMGEEPIRTAQRAPTPPVSAAPEFRAPPVSETYRPMDAGAPAVAYSSVGGDPYVVQVGSFADIANAQDVYASLSSTWPVTIVPARVNGADWFRVVVGPVDGRRAAENVQADIRLRGFGDGLIRVADTTR